MIYYYHYYYNIIIVVIDWKVIVYWGYPLRDQGKAQLL